MNELDSRGDDVFEFVELRFALEATSTEFLQTIIQLVVLRALVLRQASRMLGIPLAEILGMSHRALTHRIGSLEYESAASGTSFDSP